LTSILSQFRTIATPLGIRDCLSPTEQALPEGRQDPALLGGAAPHFRGGARIARFTRKQASELCRTPPAHDPYLDTWDNSFRNLGVGAEPVGDGFFRLRSETGVNIIPPEGPRFPGRVAVLMGPNCSSATFQFAQLAQANGLARLFGETSGGNLRGINGGSFFFVPLPASGLEFDLPLVGFFPPGAPPDAGLAPDVRIAPTLESIAKGEDPVLEAVSSWMGAS
jgi:hypothetical protein